MEKVQTIACYIEKIPWKTIGAFFALGTLYFIAFSKDVSLLNRQEKKRLVQLKKQTGNKYSGHLINTLLGLLFVLISLLLYYFFYKK